MGVAVAVGDEVAVGVSAEDGCESTAEGIAGVRDGNARVVIPPHADNNRRRIGRKIHPIKFILMLRLEPVG